MFPPAQFHRSFGPVKKTPAKSKTKRTSARSSASTDVVPEAFAPVASAFAKDRSVTAGLMMASYGLKVNGKIFAMQVKERFVAKLPKSRVDALVDAGVGERFDPGHGRVMKEWVSIAPGKTDCVALAREAYDFVKQGKAR
jgi:hypothetical protein